MQRSWVFGHQPELSTLLQSPPTFSSLASGLAVAVVAAVVEKAEIMASGKREVDQTRVDLHRVYSRERASEVREWYWSSLLPEVQHQAAFRGSERLILRSQSHAL